MAISPSGLWTKRLVWVTGANGLIGNHLVQTAPQFASHWRVRALTREQLDLLDLPAVRREFQKDTPQLIIHCAGISKSAICDKDPALARKVNVDATALLAELAQDIPFIFFSTDLVFDGLKGNYVEADKVNPPTVYGETKATAEKIVLANPRHTVIRTSLNAGASPTGDRAFNEQMRSAWETGQTLNLFSDEFRSPIHAVVTARAVWDFVDKELTGLFHIAGSERLSRVQIGELLAARCPQLNPNFKVGSLKDYHGPPRSPDTSLDSSKVQKHLSFGLPKFSEWLATNPNEYF